MIHKQRIFDLTCRKCGKKIDSIFWGYGKEWFCSECAPDKENVLFCEDGCKVQVVSLDYGYELEQEFNKKYLKKGGIYTVKAVEVGRSSSEVELQEFPDISFNSVIFKRVE